MIDGQLNRHVHTSKRGQGVHQQGILVPGKSSLDPCGSSLAVGRFHTCRHPASSAVHLQSAAGKGANIISARKVLVRLAHKQRKEASDNKQGIDSVHFCSFRMVCESERIFDNLASAGRGNATDVDQLTVKT